MNKLIIICGSDRLGKTSLIKGLCEYYDYKNIIIRHCDKPPKNLSAKDTLNFQFKCFKQEFKLITYVNSLDDKFCYHNNIIIYDRFHLGEYVYSQMFRGGDAKELKKRLIKFEEGFISHEVYLITLTADPEFFNSRESDGHELSKTLDQKSKELELFKEAHNFSIVPNKLLLKVDKEVSAYKQHREDLEFLENTNIFRTKEDILNEVLTFTNIKTK
jgi:thymidylate kinase